MLRGWFWKVHQKIQSVFNRYFVGFCETSHHQRPSYRNPFIVFLMLKNKLNKKCFDDSAQVKTSGPHKADQFPLNHRIVATKTNEIEKIYQFFFSSLSLSLSFSFPSPSRFFLLLYLLFFGHFFLEKSLGSVKVNTPSFIYKTTPWSLRMDGPAAPSDRVERQISKLQSSSSETWVGIAGEDGDLTWRIIPWLVSG